MDNSPSESLSIFLKMCTLGIHSSSLLDVLDHLKSGSIPGLHSNNLADIEVIKHKIGALQMLESVMISSSFHKDLPNGPGAAPDLIHAAWQDIWHWIVFHYTKCITNQRYGERCLCMTLFIQYHIC